MFLQNPYIKLTKENDKILMKQEEIFSKKGKWKDFFGDNKKIRLEIGTGLGNFFSQESFKNQEDYNYIGMEIKYKRLFKTAEKTSQNGNTNFIVIKEFGQNIDKIFANEEIETTFIFFPDPWRKDKQSKHRLLQKDFLEKLYEITEKNGKFIFKTDHKEYFEETLEIIEKLGFWQAEIISFDYENKSDKFEKENITEFEGIFRGQKLQICYAEFMKKSF